MSKKILLVDDSATARALFKICFNDNSEYKIIESNQWQDAIKKAKQHKPYIIVLDYNMPEKTGGELAKKMQEQGIKAHYILITANTQQSVLDEVKSLGFFEVLEKPITAEQIQLLLEKLNDKV